MPTRVWVVFGPEWGRATAALRTIEESTPHWIQEELRDAIEPLVQSAKSAAMRVEIEGGPEGHTGLRSRVSAGVGYRAGLSTRNTAYFRIFTSMAENDEAIIPRGMDRAAGWRHPLFGNKNHWYTSRPVRTGWFTDTIADGRDEIQRAIEDALERAANLVDAVS